MNPLTYTCTYKLYLPQRKQLQEDMTFLAGLRQDNFLKEIFHLFETGVLCKLPKIKQGANSNPNCAGRNFKGKEGYLHTEVSAFKLGQKCELYH